MKKYGIVKGVNFIINNDIKREFIGMNKNFFGFDVLIDNIEKIKKVLGKEVLIERVSLEDIMVYIVRGDRNV